MAKGKKGARLGDGMKEQSFEVEYEASYETKNKIRYDAPKGALHHGVNAIYLDQEVFADWMAYPDTIKVQITLSALS